MHVISRHGGRQSLGPTEQPLVPRLQPGLVENAGGDLTLHRDVGIPLDVAGPRRRWQLLVTAVAGSVVPVVAGHILVHERAAVASAIVLVVAVAPRVG